MGEGSWVQEHTVHLDEPGRVLTLLSTPSDVDAEREPLIRRGVPARLPPE